MTTKPKGIHATFSADCWKCGNELTVTQGRIDPHDCRPKIIRDLDDIEFPEAD